MIFGNVLTEVSVEPGFRLVLTYEDGHQASVDMSDMLEGEALAFLKNEQRFARVTIAHRGAAVLWVDDEGDEIDFCADALRIKADTQAVSAIAAAE